MPMDFPDMQSLERHAEMVGFRRPLENESEDHYRIELADFVRPMDFIESEEIRNKVGWNKFSDKQNENMVFGAFLNNFSKRGR